MKLYLMRHAEAVPVEFWPENDLTRPLTDLAQAQIVGLAQHMKRLGFHPPVILTSPYERAKQTGQELCEALGWDPPVVVSELASGARGDQYRTGLIPYDNKDEILIVGHMPDVSIVASRFVGSAALMEERFQPGEMMALDIPDINEWGKSKVLWKRKFDDWKESK